MNARIAPKRLSHSEALSVTQQALECTAPAVTAAVLYILYRRGWHKDKLKALFLDIVSFFKYPQYFNKYLTDIEIQNFLSDKLDIDWNDLKSVVKVDRRREYQ